MEFTWSVSVGRKYVFFSLFPQKNTQKPYDYHKIGLKKGHFFTKSAQNRESFGTYP